MNIEPISTNIWEAGRPDKGEGYLAIGRRMVKVQLGKEIAAKSNIVYPKINDTVFLDLAERTITQDTAWQKEYETRIAAYCALFEDAGIMNLPQEKVEQIRAQARQYPLIQAALENLTKESLPDLVKLSNLIADTIQDSDDETALMQLTTMPQDLRAELNKIKTESKRDLRELERKGQAVTAKALQYQAALFEAMIEGKKWANLQPQLQSEMFGSFNQVHKLFKSLEPEIVAAYFKVGLGGEPSGARMEKLIWDIAVILGLEESFVATGKMVLKQQLGGIQPVQEGIVLEDADDDLNIPKEEIAKAILISIIFGMFDAHHRNIFITPDNKIKYFDNTRSMPNSNSCINTFDHIIPAYRCALLDLPDAHLSLSPAELDALKSQVASVKEKMHQVQSFLKSPQITEIVKKLPPYWLDVDASLKAMQERIERVENGLLEGKIQTAADLVIAFNPDYKFIFASVVVYQSLEHGSGDKPHNNIGKNDMRSIWSTIGKKINLNKLKERCDDPSLSLDDLLKKAKKASFVKTIRLEKDEPQESNNKIIEEMAARAAYDFKDVPRSYCETFIAEKEKVKKVP